MKAFKIVMTIMISLLFAMTGMSYAQFDELADKETDTQTADSKDVTFSIHGYVQGSFVVERNDDKKLSNKWNTSKYEFPRIGAELQLELEGNAYDIAHFFSAVRVEYNAAGKKTNFFDRISPIQSQKITYFDYYYRYDRNEINREPTLLIRETYVDLYASWLTFRAGHQMISWGEIEGVEAPSDVVMPWDFTTMSNVFEDSRVAVTAAAFNIFFAKQKLELIWIPLFQPAVIPEYVFLKKGVNRITRPRFEVRNSEYAARMSGSIGEQFRYGVGFLYGFDDMPDANVRLVGTPISMMGFPIIMPTAMETELVYNRVMVPTLDLGIGLGDVLSWKLSGNAHFRKDHEGKSHELKNSTVTYLTGIESSNLFAKIYMALYVGQHWVLNYSKPIEEDPYSLIKMVMNLNALKSPSTKDTLTGYDQLKRYRWIISSNIQRTFLEGGALDMQIRFAVYINPNFKKADYVVNPYFTYKFTNGVSTSIGFQIADRLNVDKNLAMLEVRYTF